MFFGLAILALDRVDDFVRMYSRHARVGDQVHTIATELVFRVSGDSLGVGVQNMRTALYDMDGHVLAAKLRVLGNKVQY